MQEVFRLIERAGPSDKAILIQGESGTGKELVARALHQCSLRADRPMVVINCAALPEALLESELFGHEKGAFTGAVSAKAGLFETADGGTLFIDEIGELPLDLQGAFLRVLESASFTPVGGEEAVSVDVRIVAATNRDLRQMVEARTFRQDLYYRLGEITLALPALRDRPEDMGALVSELEKALLPRSRTDGRRVRFDEAAVARLAAHPWPGNVRELRNYVARSLALATRDVIGEADLLPFEPPGPGGSPAAEAPRGAEPPPSGGQLKDVELAMVRSAMARHRGNKSRAARELGIPVSTLRGRLRRLGLE